MFPPPDPIIRRQLVVIEKIIRDETWLEGERRGGPVSPEDPTVLEHVCGIILRIGQNLRLTLAPDLPGETGDSHEQTATDSHAA